VEYINDGDRSLDPFKSIFGLRRYALKVMTQIQEILKRKVKKKDR